MRVRARTRLRMIAAVLGVFGVLLWVTAATVHLTPLTARDVAVGHMEGRSIGIVAGGISVAAGIALFAIAA